MENTEITKKCPFCAELINIEAIKCKHCGSMMSDAPKEPSFHDQFKTPRQVHSRKDWLTTLVLCFFLGSIGAHRFYTKNTDTAIIQMLTLGGCGVWVLIDLIFIISGKFKDADGFTVVNN